MLYTIGYEGLSLEQFITVLKENDIKRIIDVREYPVSRKTGFSKNILNASLVFFDVDYTHIKNLGCPKEVRNTYKLTQDWNDYRKGFNAYVKLQNDSLDEVFQLAEEKRSALLCFEANHNRCHRSLITAEMIRRYKIDSHHIDIVKAKKEIAVMNPLPIFA